MSGDNHLSSDEDHSRMPPVFKIEDYDSCLKEAGGRYCQVKFALVSDQPSELLNMIREYSVHYTTHFNYTQLRHGVCLSRCVDYVPSDDLDIAIESCLNNTFWEDYKLKTKLLEFTCNSSRRFDLLTADVFFGLLSVVLLIFNVVGSVSYYNGPSSFRHMKFAQCFAVQRNWQKLIRISEIGPDPRLERLKALHGIRAINAILVVLVHGLLPAMLFIENTHYVESFYHDVEKHILLNGTPTIQTFFILSGFLLVFKFLLYSETNTITWNTINKILLKRLMRLFPVYGFMLALTCTWVRFMGDGPGWDILVTEEHNDCKKLWWKNLLFINNYDDSSKCYPHTWTSACDMQLFTMGVLICVSCKMNLCRSRNRILGTLLLLGIIIPCGTIYYYDLDGALIITPTLVGKLFMNDPNYDQLYKRGHTNLFNFVLGMSLGYFMYDVQMNIDLKKYQKYKPFYWSLVPAAVVFMLVGGIFYHDGPRLPMTVRMVYGTLSKTLFGVIITTLIAGMILNYEDLYRNILEWPRWVPLSRISYSSYVMHATLIRVYIGTSRKVNYFTYPWIIKTVVLIITLTFVFAAILWLLVEEPFNQVREYLMKSSDMETISYHNERGIKERDTKKKTI